jgi:parallel beta-helix repeat protein
LGCIGTQVIGNTVETGSEHGISIAGLSHTSMITDNTVYGSTLNGLEIAASAQCSVKGNTLRDCVGGIIINTSNLSTVNGNTIIGSTDHAITYQNCIRGGTCVGNTIDGWGSTKAGINASATGHLKIVANTIYKNNTGGSGVNLEHVAYVIVGSNEMDGGDYGVTIYQSGGGSTSDVHVHNNEFRSQIWQKIRLIGTLTSLRIADNSHQFRTVAPSDSNESHWFIGTKVWNSTPTGGGTMGWVCTVTGDSSGGGAGTWKAMPNLAA